ncbi:sulfotransferase 1B1-like isoform X1 [Haliotis asinina]|uniref:sulfotransferase 1B1-like isoform X1 n=2 Tax=Haliotis asinina TaxID=109174 RepID=UPI0035327DED
MATTDKQAAYTVNDKVLEVDLTGQDIVWEKDRHGEKLMFQMYEGVRCGCFIDPARVKNFQLRPEDIYFPGYLRTGGHWIWEMTCMLINGKAETITRFKDYLELSTVEDLDKQPSPRVLNCHSHLTQAPLDLKKKKCRVIFTMRDPKDVAVSLYKMHHGHRDAGGNVYNGTFEDFLQLFLEQRVNKNGIFEHVRDAEKYFQENPDVPVHYQLYEDTQKDPVAAVRAISDFLGLQRDDDLCRAIAEECHFSKMKEKKEAFAMKVDGANNLYGKGVSGEWRNWFTDAMLDDYYRVFEDQMKGSRFYERYNRHNDTQ